MLAQAAVDQVARLEAGVRETHALADATQQAFISVQRAFVGAKFIDPVGLTNLEGKTIVAWQFQTQWENNGTTPTRSALNHVSFAWRPSSLPKDFAYPDLGDSKNMPFVIGPKESVSSGLMPVNSDIIKQVQEGKMHLYFWGWATYHDVFKSTPEHVTKFCAELTTIHGNVLSPQVASRQWVYTHCGQHNCTDEECGDYHRY
jgi:hypothetical protein